LKYTSHSGHKTFEHEFALVLEKGPFVFVTVW